MVKVCGQLGCLQVILSLLILWLSLIVPIKHDDYVLWFSIMRAVGNWWFQLFLQLSTITAKKAQASLSTGGQLEPL